MYKILNSQGLGVAGKQNELIELALTHDFHGVEVDIVDLVGRHDALGKEFACQFLQRHKIDMGTFSSLRCWGRPKKTTRPRLPSWTRLSIWQPPSIANVATCRFNQPAVCMRSRITLSYTSRGCERSEKKWNLRGSVLGSLCKRAMPSPPKVNLNSSKRLKRFRHLPKLSGQANVGLCLDSWEWVVGGGTLAQLEDLDVNQTITELRLADVPADTDLETITKNDRSNLPGEEADAVSFNLTKQLLAAGYEGSISAATSLSSFADGPRDKVVGSISRRLDQFIAGEDPAAIAAAEQAEAIEAESAANSEEESSAVAAGTSEN